jgi:CRP/FNR family transcriptional regulator, cyclic AMP receptor protein
VQADLRCSVTPGQFVRAHPLLSSLTAAEAAALIEQSVVKSFPARSTVFLEGGVGDGVYGVLTGSVLVTVGSARGDDLILSVLPPGRLFGELAVLDGGGRTASTVTRVPSSLLFISRAVFLRVIATHPQLAAGVGALLGVYLRRNTRQASDAAFLDVAGRLARQLIELEAGVSVGESPRPTIQVSQYELACMLGVSREIVNRHLTSWRRAGLVEMSRGHLRIVDRRAMLALAADPA